MRVPNSGHIGANHFAALPWRLPVTAFRSCLPYGSVSNGWSLVDAWPTWHRGTCSRTNARWDRAWQPNQRTDLNNAGLVMSRTFWC